MHVTLVQVHVAADGVASFIEATRRNHEASIREAGNHRFDVLQSESDPTRFVLYEAYASEADSLAHKETQHYREWRQTVGPLMAEPRHGAGYVGLFPSGPGD